MTETTRKRPRRRTPLTRETVLRKAVELADEAGLDGLSMRRLAKELGVEAMSLYNHVANKDDLLGGIADLVAREVEIPPDDVDWKTAIRSCALSAHEVFRRHPWACNLSLEPERVSPASVYRGNWILRRLHEAGFPPEVTYHAFHAIDAHILGFTLWQLQHRVAEGDMRGLVVRFTEAFPREEYPYIYEHAEQHLAGFGHGEPGAFVLVLDLILDGLERRLHAGG